MMVEPVAYVRAGRDERRDDFWGGTVARIELADGYDTAALAGLEEFSHVEIAFVFDRIAPADVLRGAKHPRENPAWPRVGIFAQRASGRPNRLGLTICRVVAVEGRTLVVAELDALDGTPVVDIKPVLREFLPRGEVRQPSWAGELMADYWRAERDEQP